MVKRQHSLFSKNIFELEPSPNNLLNESKPPGLFTDRQAYLHEKIKEFCPVHKNKVCSHLEPFVIAPPVG